MLLSVSSAFAQSGETPLKGDVTGDGIVNVADIVSVIVINKYEGSGGSGTGTTYYWYIGTNLPAESDKNFEPTKPTLPVDDSQLATGNHEGWRKIGTTIPKGVIYDAQSSAIRFNKVGYYYLIIPNGVKVETSDGNNYLNGFESSGEYGPDSTTIPGYTIYSSRWAGNNFTGIIKY